MYPSTPEHYLQAELNFRRERIRTHFAAAAMRRAARRVRQQPATRHTAAHRPARLATRS
jgi:hypothetical protein